MPGQHSRIDEGVKHPKHEQPPITRPVEGQSWTIPDGLDPDKILTEYLTAGATSGIAALYGVRRAALTRWLQNVRPREWKEVQIIRALCTKEDGTEQIYDARTALQLARARDLRKAAEFDLERLDAATWGQQTHLTVEHVGDLADRLRRALVREEARVINPALQQLQETAQELGNSGVIPIESKTSDVT